MKDRTNLTRYLIPALILLVGIGFVIYGVTDGEALSVLRKAVAICMECIGIG